MKLGLIRDIRGKHFTLGKLYIDGQFFCYTCEDAVRQTKIYGETAIPPGSYNVSLTWSNRFKRVLPLIENVPNFSGIRIHAGNTAADTEGCPLIGLTRTAEGVADSRKAMELFMPRIKAAWDADEIITIEVV
jgi:hypothetical protein